ncbi:MAG TPA: RNA polymerase sigma-70 factor [Arachidicoccus sp.]|nr:RNA polymerase sigma-70 factor [Arachidicoccus sp.]
MIDQERLQILQQQLSVGTGNTAYENIYALVFPDLLRFAVSIIHSQELAEEIVSDVMIGVWRQKEQVGIVKDFRLYLYVSTKNTALNYLKSQKLRLSSGDSPAADWDWDQSIPQFKSVELDPEALIEFSELRRKVESAIEALPPKCRIIYQLIKEDGLKYKEAAHLLQLSIKTIEHQMHIALQKLHKALD